MDKFRVNNISLFYSLKIKTDFILDVYFKWNVNLYFLLWINHLGYISKMKNLNLLYYYYFKFINYYMKNNVNLLHNFFQYLNTLYMIFYYFHY